VSPGLRGVFTITLARSTARTGALVLRSTRRDRRPRFGQFAVLLPGRWWQNRLTLSDRRARSWTFAQGRSKPGSASKNETLPQNAPSFTDRGRSRLCSRLLKTRQSDASATPKQKREAAPSFPKLPATTDGNLHDYRSCQQRDADGQSERDPTSSSAPSARSLNEAEIKRI
jgi:hypothetical protein